MDDEIRDEIVDQMESDMIDHWDRTKISGDSWEWLYPDCPCESAYWTYGHEYVHKLEANLYDIALLSSLCSYLLKNEGKRARSLWHKAVSTVFFAAHDVVRLVRKIKEAILGKDR